MSPTRICAIWILAAAMTGCAATAGHWSDPPGWPHDAHIPDEQELAEARHAYISADNAEALRGAIATMEALLADSPGLESLRVNLAEAYTLLGAAYGNSRRQKRDYFQTAQRHAERVLMGRPGFRQALEDGQRPGLAAQRLTGEDVPAMVIWATATAYLFDEGMSSLGRVRNYRGLEDLRLFMERAFELDPEYEYGLVPFSLAIFYVATPRFAGGDLDRAARWMAQAVETPGISLMPRWGRARYLHTLTGDRQAKRTDLEWVLAQDARAADSPYPWNIYVQQDARRMLAELD